MCFSPTTRTDQRAFPLIFLALIFASATSVTGCQEPDSPKKVKQVRIPKAATLIAAPVDGDVAALVMRATSDARKRGSTLIVYVGAAWCEPCTYFHNAIANGELDTRLSDLEFLEFDLDRDRDRLAAAKYDSKMIPLFALPDNTGRGTQQRIIGSIKGPGAIENIVPRLYRLLERPSPAKPETND